MLSVHIQKLGTPLDLVPLRRVMGLLQCKRKSWKSRPGEDRTDYWLLSSTKSISRIEKHKVCYIRKLSMFSSYNEYAQLNHSSKCSVFQLCLFPPIELGLDSCSLPSLFFSSPPITIVVCYNDSLVCHQAMAAINLHGMLYLFNKSQVVLSLNLKLKYDSFCCYVKGR